MNNIEKNWSIVNSVGRQDTHTHTWSVVFLSVFNLFEVLLGFQYCNMCAIPKRKSCAPISTVEYRVQKGAHLLKMKRKKKSKSRESTTYDPNDKIPDLSTPYLSFSIMVVPSTRKDDTMGSNLF